MLTLDSCSFCQGESGSFFKIKAVLTVLESDLLRRFRVWVFGTGRSYLIDSLPTGFRRSHTSHHDFPKVVERRCAGAV